MSYLEIKPVIFGDEDNQLDLGRLTFGSDDAERDVKHGFLDKVFLKTIVYHRIKEGRRELVIGRKGSGKSAICLMLRDAFDAEGVNTILVTPKSLSQTRIQKLETSSINQEETYILCWKYILLVEIAKCIIQLKNKGKVQISRRTINKVRIFLEKNGEIEKGVIRSWMENSRKISKLSIKILSLEGEIQTNKTEILNQLSEEIDSFEDIIKNIDLGLKDNQILMLLDRIDEIWSRDEESISMITGLIRAVHDVNSLINSVNVILFLRSDIYDRLKFNDADKFRSLEERINWTKVDLKHLIANRGKFSAKLTHIDINTLWNAIFDEKLLNRDSFEYILERTMMRPRELIQFCNNALAIAQNASHKKITQRDILAAEEQYSNWKLNDLTSEFSVQYPFLDDLLSLFQGYKVSFTRDEFDIRYAGFRNRIESKYSGLRHMSVNSILQILYIIGFAGTKIHRESTYVYDDPKIVIAQQNQIYIHPAFHLALGILSFDSFLLGSGRSNIIVAGDVVRGDKILLPEPLSFDQSIIDTSQINDLGKQIFIAYSRVRISLYENYNQEQIMFNLKVIDNHIHILESICEGMANFVDIVKSVEIITNSFIKIQSGIIDRLEPGDTTLQDLYRITHNIISFQYLLIQKAM